MATATPKPPAPASYREPPALYRQAVSILSSGDLRGDQWRTLVGGAPIVRSCLQTQVMHISSIEWHLEGEDTEAVDYFTTVLEGADNGEGWEVFLSRILEDCMLMPFGGASEIGNFPNGVVAWIAHIDAGTLVPTYDPKFPYAQIDPWQAARPPVPFTEEQIGRIRWQPETRLRAYGWTKTPAMDALSAIQALLRADRFWQSFLLDTPPVGILDLMDMSEQDATDWYKSWKGMLQGIDPFKVPIIYGGGEERKQPAHFIEFHKTPAELSMLDILKQYAEQVCACFGMNLGDLGLFGQELRLAGATKLIDLSKKQGQAKLMRSVKNFIDMDVLPEDVTFRWDVADLEDGLRVATAANMRATSIATLANPMVGVISAEEGRQAAIIYGIIPEDAITQAAQAMGGLMSGTADNEDAAKEDTDNQPTGMDIEDDLEGRAYRAKIHSFPAQSKWAKRMAAVATKLLAPAKRGLTKPRIKRLIDVGMRAYEQSRSIERVTIETSARDKARAALDAALAQESWWQSPDLTDEVFTILKGAYEEGMGLAIDDIEAQRLSLGLDGIALDTTDINLTNKVVLKALEERGGQLITNLDPSTQRYITNAIMRGVERGASSPEIARDILADDAQKTIIEQWGRRTQGIVNTEINWAESKAAVDQVRNMGLTKKRWNAVPGIACDICQGNADLGAVDIDYEYETATGMSTETPGHPGVCHCWMTQDKDELMALGNDASFWLGG